MREHDLDLALDALRKDDGSHLGSVSSRVMAQIEAEARRRRTALWLSLAAAAALIVVVLLIPRGSAPPPVAVAEARGSAPLQSRLGNAQPAHAAHRPAAHRAATVRERAATKAGPLEVRMQTDDPDVLIIWLVDGEQQEEGQKGNQ